MATGVKPRDEESKLTRADLDILQDAMKQKKFRELLSEYCEEIRDPANRAVYQKEMTQLEKERGYDVTFINPKAGYVIKTSVAGDRKAFINICSNDNIDKPSCKVQEVDRQKGMSWQLPYSLIPPREDYNNKKERCVIYDVVFHPDTLRMAEVNKRFRELVNRTAFDGLQKTYDIHLDINNIRFPKSYYKGMSVPAVIRKEDPDYNPNKETENSVIDPEGLEKLYPQHNYSHNSDNTEMNKVPQKISMSKINPSSVECLNIDFSDTSADGYTTPKYIIKQQKNVDFQEFTYSKDSKQYTAIPNQIIVEINLPLLSSTKDCILDVKNHDLNLTSEKPAKYKLNIKLPYAVNEDSGKAQFDKTKHLLIVSLPVVLTPINSDKIDSYVESEEISGSHSEEDCKDLIVELNSSSTVNAFSDNGNQHQNSFLLPNIGYIIPTYTYNVLDNIVALTFHVKNTDPASVEVKNNNNIIEIKFSSMGAGFVPLHYAAMLSFPNYVKFNDAIGEAWDNNVILQLEVADKVPNEFEIGLSQELMVKEYLDVSNIKTTVKPEFSELPKIPEDTVAPVVEVTNFGTETNILLSSSNQRDCQDETDETMKGTDITWTGQNNCVDGTKSNLRKVIAMSRSYSESSYGDVASSMDYISSDCIPEESSLKKTVRFNDVIARKIFRLNSSIEGQKKKNQRKKSKKRNQERRKSESEAEDESSNSMQFRLKPVLKQRRDSGLADTSDAEADIKNISNFDKYNSATETDENSNENDAITKPSVERKESKSVSSQRENKFKKTTKKGKRCNDIEHNTDLYDPGNLNKGQYSEVKFKNDLIFDLDM